MDLTSGIFTTPRPGTYFFSFTGLAYLYSSSYIDFLFRIYLNGNVIGSSHVYQGISSDPAQYSPLTLQSTLSLVKGDQIWVTINYFGSMSSLYDSFSHFTHFTGFLLQEELVASL
jgi:hypothetical protein